MLLNCFDSVGQSVLKASVQSWVTSHRYWVSLLTPTYICVVLAPCLAHIRNPMDASSVALWVLLK